MRLVWIILGAIVAGWMAGCATAPLPPRPSLWDRFVPLEESLGEDVVQVEVAVIRRLPGDVLMNDHLWERVDEQIVSFEERQMLETNGLRVGVVGGHPP